MQRSRIQRLGGTFYKECNTSNASRRGIDAAQGPRAAVLPQSGEAVIAVLFASPQQATAPGAQTGTMKAIALPTIEPTVDTVIQRWPSSTRISLNFGLHCVGCPIATFHSVEDLARRDGAHHDPAALRCRLFNAPMAAQQHEERLRIGRCATTAVSSSYRTERASREISSGSPGASPDNNGISATTERSIAAFSLSATAP
ncbi:hypothetical protein [Bradyrhizobium genosp. P]|uniref:hypothetical protein n=1 Tax=Bradyrhizobium genosp. P TaxID=83641 RepID=UPI003CE81833